MKRVPYIKFLFGVVIAMVGCSTEDVSYDVDSLPITFSTTMAELSVETKAAEVITEGETEFGRYRVTACDRVASTTRVSDGSFEESDKVGIYMFYNYWFADGSESVILNDDTLTVDSSGGCELDPMRLWTFSSIGGDAPHHLHAVAYYPESAETSLSYSTEDDPATLKWTCDPTVDFRVACTEYDYTDDEGGTSTTDRGSRFKTYITETLNGKVSLSFVYKRATLSFYIYKASGLGEITIESLTIKSQYYPDYAFDTEANVETWSGDLTGSSTTLNVTSGGTLGEEYDGVPTDSSMKAPKLELSDEIYLPCMSEVVSISFDLIVDSVSETYTWHPHIENMDGANYQIQFELDPNRNN